MRARLKGLLFGLSMVACVVALFALTNCSTLLPFTKKVDDVCVAGRLSQEQADAINTMTWEAGGTRAAVKVDDRVLRMECSECLKSFTQGKDRGDRSQCGDVIKGLRQ